MGIYLLFCAYHCDNLLSYYLRKRLIPMFILFFLFLLTLNISRAYEVRPRAETGFVGGRTFILIRHASAFVFQRIPFLLHERGTNEGMNDVDPSNRGITQLNPGSP